MKFSELGLSSKGTKLNKRGGVDSVGKFLSSERYISIMQIYQQECRRRGSCTVRKLADLAKCSTHSASKSIKNTIKETKFRNKLKEGMVCPESDHCIQRT